MKTVLFSFLFFFSCINTFSQTWTWDTLTSQKAGSKFAKDNFQHIYSYTRNDTILNKLTTSGVPLWKKTFPLNFKMSGVTCSADSSVYIVGTFSGSITFTGTNFTANFNSRGLADLCLLKISPSGNIIWATEAGSKGNDAATDVCMNGLDVIIIGTVSDTVHLNNITFPKSGSDAFFIAKYFNSGVLDTLFLPTASGQDWGDTYGQEVEVDNAGNIISTIYLMGGTTLDTSFISGYYSTLLLKFNQNLNIQWNKYLAGYKSGASNLTIAQQNDILFTVHHSSQYHPTFSGIQKIASSGGSISTYYWNHYGALQGLGLDSCLNIYFTGWHMRWQGQFFTPVNSVLVGKLSPIGILNWVRKDSSTLNRYGTDVIAIGPDKCYLSVSFNNTITLTNTFNVGANNPGYLHGIVQASFGIPVNNTPVSNQLRCANKTTTLNCNSAGTINWYASLQSITPLHSGISFVTPVLSPGSYTYYAEATTCTMTSGRLPVTVSVNALPNITAADGTICAGQFFQLNGSGGINYFYPSNNPLVFPSSSTSYTLSGSDANGCVNTATCLVTVNPAPQLSITSSQNTICAGQSATINCYGAQTYSWNNGATQAQIIVSPLTTTGYLVTGYNTSGCSSIVMLTQRVADCTGIAENKSVISLSIFPNPGNGLFTIKSTINAQVRIIDALGSLRHRQNIVEGSQNIDLTNLIKGIYFVEIVNGSTASIQKIIIE